MNTEIDPQLQERIHELGFRMTPQRLLILQAIERAGEHATFDEIYSEVNLVAPTISPATVYRTLETFSRYRLIHGNEVAGGKVYETVSERPHHHLMCHRCWSDQKIEEKAIRGFYQKMDKEQGFLVLAEHIIFMGLCEECRREAGDRLGRFSPHPKFRKSPQGGA